MHDITRTQFIIWNDPINFNEVNTCQIIYVISMHVHLVQFIATYSYFIQENSKTNRVHTYDKQIYCRFWSFWYLACWTNSIRKFQLHDLNARLTMNVLHTLHASVKNVKIRAKPIHVASTLNVWLGIIEPFVSASMDMLEILLQFVKNVSYTQKIMFGCPFR